MKRRYISNDAAKRNAAAVRVTGRTAPSKRIVRGLEWIWRMARADFEAASGELGTGAFAGTTEKEVDEALDWLNNLTRKP